MDGSDDSQRLYSLVALVAGVAAIVLASGLLPINAFASASVLIASGLTAISLTGTAFMTDVGRTANRLGCVLFTVGMLTGIAAVYLAVSADIRAKSARQNQWE